MINPNNRHLFFCSVFGGPAWQRATNAPGLPVDTPPLSPVRRYQAGSTQVPCASHATPVTLKVEEQVQPVSSARKHRTRESGPDTVVSQMQRLPCTAKMMQDGSGLSPLLLVPPPQRWRLTMHGQYVVPSHYVPSLLLAHLASPSPHWPPSLRSPCWHTPHSPAQVPLQGWISWTPSSPPLECQCPQ